MPPLTPRQRLVRLGIIAVSALVLSLPLLKNLNPSLPALPCGFKALTGLPCLFCGGTRSACAALRGDFAYSLYLNALSIPLIAFILLLACASLLEITRGRPFADWHSLSKPFFKHWPALILLLLAWWAVHLISALRTPKPELLNPKNPIARRLCDRQVFTPRPFRSGFVFGSLWRGSQESSEIVIFARLCGALPHHSSRTRFGKVIPPTHLIWE
jgi:hypothetical protein